MLVNETVHRNSSSLFSVCFMDAAKLMKTVPALQNSKLIL
jgi:hypothetical protein